MIDKAYASVLQVGEQGFRTGEQWVPVGAAGAQNQPVLVISTGAEVRKMVSIHSSEGGLTDDRGKRQVLRMTRYDGCLVILHQSVTGVGGGQVFNLSVCASGGGILGILAFMCPHLVWSEQAYLMRCFTDALFLGCEYT